MNKQVKETHSQKKIFDIDDLLKEMESRGIDTAEIRDEINRIREECRQKRQVTVHA